MKNINKEKIKLYILEHICSKDKEYVKKAIDTFHISKSSVYNYINEMFDGGIIERSDKNPTGYVLTYKRQIFNYNNKEKLEEDRIFKNDILPALEGLPKDIIDNWRYAFTEIMNNAIEHSSSDTIICSVATNSLHTKVIVIDNGIGIFKNIQKYIEEEKHEKIGISECISLLFAGKFTTAKENHSGEGIFFTSHLMDSFTIVSDEHIFTRRSFSDLHSELKSYDFLPDNVFKTGTAVHMKLSNSSKKTLGQVFGNFSNADDGFFRTHIPVAHMFADGFPVSRSEARRLGEVLLRFKEVTLDFIDVEKIGQAFAHELFIVLKNLTGAKLTVVNANDEVLTMISRVENTN